MKRLWILIVLIIGLCPKSKTQSCDCPYPILLLHGYTGDDGTFVDTYTNPDFINTYGPRADVYHAVINAVSSTNIWGADGIEGTADDDVLYSFNNLSNSLAPGCVYSINFRNWWNEDPLNPQIIINGCSAPGFFDSDSNESAIVKQGYVLGKMIQAVLSANPDKDKVILVGHSMGGLEAREYLQRNTNNWANPFAADGHQVKKLVTVVTPHGGSNFASFIKDKNEDHPTTRDGVTDANSDAVRDLRYNYGCGFFGNCAAPYLYGGDEDDVPTFLSYHSSDVNCNGVDNDNNIIGINAAGTPNAWDGTTYNLSLPLPLDIKYSYITSNWVFGSDGVVDIDRQWLYTGATPTPSDGQAHRLTDTLLTNWFHSNVDSDFNTIVRALDEGDYPTFAWELKVDNGLNYAVVPHQRAALAPDGSNSQDPDWFTFEVAAGFSDSLCIALTPNSSNGGKIEYFGSTGSYTSLSSAGTFIETFTAAGSVASINLGPNDYSSGTNYIRILSEGVSGADWSDPHKISITSKLVLPVEWLSFDASAVEDKVLLNWSTALEINNSHFEILKSLDSRNFSKIATVKAGGNTTQESDYQFNDNYPQEGLNFYKIRQVDYDGTSSETAIVKVEFSVEENEYLIYPNPVSHSLSIEVLREQYDQYAIYDALGKLISKSSITKGLTALDLSSLKNGMYILELSSSSSQTTAQQRFSKI